MNQDELRNLESVITDCLDVLQTCMNRFKYVETQVRKLLQEEPEQKPEFTFTAHGIANEPKSLGVQVADLSQKLREKQDSLKGLISKMTPEERAQFKQKLSEASNPQDGK